VTFAFGLVVHPALAAALEKRGRTWGAKNRERLREMREELAGLRASSPLALGQRWASHVAGKRVALGGGSYVRSAGVPINAGADNS
jgi:hypothetical protein